MPGHPLRQPRVGHDRAWHAPRLHPRQGVEAGARPRPAVDADDVGTRLGKGGGGLLDARAVDGDKVLAEGHLGDDRQVGDGPHLADRGQQVPQVEEGLDDEEVDTTFEQPLDLLAEDGPDLAVGQVTELARGSSERSHRTRDEHVPAADIAGLAGDLCGPSVEPPDLALQPPGLEAMAVGTEGQRLDEVRAGLDVLTVEGADEVGSGHRKLVEAGPLRDPPAEQQRAHAPVGEHRAAREPRSQEGSGVHAGRLPGLAVRAPEGDAGRVAVAPRAHGRPAAAAGSTGPSIDPERADCPPIATGRDPLGTLRRHGVDEEQVASRLDQAAQRRDRRDRSTRTNGSTRSR